MKLLRNLSGLTAAIVLSITMVASASAQASTTSGTAEMAEGPCQLTNVAMREGVEEFGTWEYDGTNYVFKTPFNSNSERAVQFETTVKINKPISSCVLTVDTSGLTQEGAVLIGKENLEIKAFGLAAPQSSYGSFGTTGSVFSPIGRSQIFQVRLDATLDEQVAPGDYTSTFTFSIENGD